jgi:photosystem II stability/assembly factor-like uncharacterized protein
MQVDELRAALSEAAAVQPPVSPTAKRDIRRRVFRRRAAGAALALAVVGGATAAVAVTAGGSGGQQGIHVATHGITDTTAPVSVPLYCCPPPPPTSAFPQPPHLSGPPAMPTGFAAASVTFISATEGWALGAVNCGAGATNCRAVLALTTDGGRTWSPVPPPPTTLSPAPNSARGVSQIRFADAVDGWAFGAELWTTHDGGQHWVRSSLTNVYALEANPKNVYAVVFDQNSTRFLIKTSPVMRDVWVTAPTWLGVGAGPVPSVQIVLTGSSGGGWILENDRTVIAGARLVSGQWQPWTPPCTSVGGPADLAASSATQLVANCTEGVWTGPSISNHVYLSSDGGTTFRRVTNAAPGSGVMSPVSGVAFVASADSIYGTFNGGTSWQTVFRGAPGQSYLTLVGFTTPSQGVAITGTGELLMTRDGGHSWAVVPFR